MKKFVPVIVLALLSSQSAFAQVRAGNAAVVKSEDAVILSSQKSGKLMKLHVKEGQSFKAGQALLSFDCAIDEAELSKAGAQYSYARKQLSSNRQLSKLNSVSELEVAMSEAELMKAKADVAIRTKEVDLCTLKAPYDGQLTQWHVRAHQTVEASAQLVSIVNNSNLIVEFILPSSMLGTVAQGSPLSVRINELGREYAAQVDRVVPQVDSVSRTIRVIARFDQPAAELWSGMSGEAKLRQSVASVPAQ